MFSVPVLLTMDGPHNSQWLLRSLMYPDARYEPTELTRFGPVWSFPWSPCFPTASSAGAQSLPGTTKALTRLKVPSQQRGYVGGHQPWGKALCKAYDLITSPSSTAREGKQCAGQCTNFSQVTLAQYFQPLISLSCNNQDAWERQP